MPREWSRGRFIISTDKDRLDRNLVHGFLRESYWARGLPRDVFERSVEGALCFGVYEGDAQVGFARVITDFATFGYIGDVFILDSHRGHGLGVWLIETILAHPKLQGFRRWHLATRDAHGLYARFGFQPAQPGLFMDRTDPDVYGR